MCKVIGIDISKQTFDVCFKVADKLVHKVFTNDIIGHKKLIEFIDFSSDYVVAMEFSGSYYLPLASYLYTQSIKVYVVNPLSVKRYSQMKFYRTKTDKKDASIIREYVITNYNDLNLWKPESEVVLKLKQLYTASELLQKQLRQSKNQLSAFTVSGVTNDLVKDSLTRVIASLSEELVFIEQEILVVCKLHFQESYELLISIPSIGPKTAMLLIVITDNFNKFSHYKKLIAYVGLSPRIYQSGTSVRGKGHICKMGKSQIRKLLYMCSWTAKRCNKTCKEMYERLKKNGKPERVIKIAIANKLLKQAFAVATSKQKYVENYKPNICF